MPKVLEKPHYSAAKGYEGFPLRSSLQFSSPIGMLLPVWFHYLQPGDKVRCSSTIITRTQPLQSSAMVKLQEHVEWFFVPMQQIYKLFEQVLYGVDDIHSSFIDSESVPDLYPYTTLADITYAMISEFMTGGDSGDPEIADMFGCGKVANAFRLMEHLGFPVEPMFAEFANHTCNYKEDLVQGEALWALAAYQRIYYSHYRLTDRENNDPFAYNFDSSYENSHVGGSQRLAKLLTIHYRPIVKDFFHGGFVSPLIGSGNIGMLDSFNNGDVDFSASFFRNYLVNEDSYSRGVDGETVVSPTSVTFDANLSTLRQSFALEKLLEITRRAGKHIDAQTLAHFGVKMPQGIADEAYFLGRHDSEIVIGDVIATAGTESDPLGQIAGKGYNHSKNFDCQYEAKTHGVLMAVYSADTSLHYQPDLEDRLNKYVRPTDFYMPEFDDLGMQPIFQYQGNMGFGAVALVHNNDIRDWTYRYWELKLKYNRVIGSMAGDMSMWTIKRKGYDNVSNALSTYLVDPRLTDDIMLKNFTTGCELWWFDYDSDMEYPQCGSDYRSTIYSDDPLFHDLYIDVELASKMSAFGLPSL